MRIILTLMINAFVCASAFSQVKQLQLPMSDGQVEFKEIIEAPGISQKELFKNAHLFFVNSFRSANDVIQFKDEESGAIIGKGHFNIYVDYWGGTKKERIRATFKIECKDEKYRVTVNSFDNDNFTVDYLNDIVSGKRKASLEFSKKFSQKAINEINNDVVNTIRSLKAQMKSSTKKEDDF